MIKLYGSKMTSAFRNHILLSEIGLDFEKAPLDMSKAEHKSADFLKLNPNGKVPCLIDGDFVLWESMAINSYLCAKYKPELLGESMEERALIEQWSYWAIVHVQPFLFRLLMSKDETVLKECRKTLPPMHQLLNDHLADKTYALGEKFTLADINLGSVIMVNNLVKNDISAYTNITKWLKLLLERPCFK